MVDNTPDIKQTAIPRTVVGNTSIMAAFITFGATQESISITNVIFCINGTSISTQTIPHIPGPIKKVTIG